VLPARWLRSLDAATLRRDGWSLEAEAEPDRLIRPLRVAWWPGADRGAKIIDLDDGAVGAQHERPTAVQLELMLPEASAARSGCPMGLLPDLLVIH
jgi:hypothetical protein